MERRGEKSPSIAYGSVVYEEICQRPEFKSAPTLEKQDEIIRRELISAREKYRVSQRNHDRQA